MGACPILRDIAVAGRLVTSMVRGSLSRTATALAKALMHLNERTPPDPETVVEGLREVFQHPLFTEGSEEARAYILRASAESRYEDENEFPWDTYFGRSVKPWVGGDTLDLGCFTGGRAVAWFQRYEPRSISGVDIDEVFIDAGRQFAASKGVPADFRVGFGEDIPWLDGSFDSILTIDVFEHVRNVRRTLEECWRVLRPGGHLLVVFPSYFQPIEHHLSLVTGTPGLQYLFSGETLMRAYSEILAERGPAATWYGRPNGLADWERGNTINGTTARQFSRYIRRQGWQVELNPRLPIGAVGHRAAHGKGKVLARVFAPLTRLPGFQEVALHRVTYVLKKRT
jgi:SAM-dependent methyltransferase